MLSVHFSLVALKIELFSQPGYLHKLLPGSAPNQPESLQDVLDGEFLNLVYYVKFCNRVK